MWIILTIIGFIAGALSGSIGFGGGMILLPVITYFYGVEVAVPVSTIAQLMSNLSRMGFGWKEAREHIDAMAACMILKSFMESNI
ncbi:MAG: hypothetical protein EOM76_04110 [Sphingobacteriia bacterium]|nr:hypothetical protein [Sphingobacteriia bacterium]